MIEKDCWERVQGGEIFPSSTLLLFNLPAFSVVLLTNSLTQLKQIQTSQLILSLLKVINKPSLLTISIHSEQRSIEKKENYQ